MVKSFPGATWESCVGRMAVDAVFASAFSHARKTYQHMKEGIAPNFLMQSFATQDEVQVVCERTCLFIPEAEVPKCLGAELKQLPHLKTMSVKLETGEVVNGALVEDPQLGSMRRVHLRSTSGTQLSGTILAAGKQLRAEQGEDLAAWYDGDFLKVRSSALGPLPSLAEVREGVQDLKRRQAAAEAEAEAAAAEKKLQDADLLQAGSGGGTQDVVDGGEQNASSESDTEESLAIQLPSQALLSGSKARGKGQRKKDQGQGRGQKRGASGKAGALVERSAARRRISGKHPPRTTRSFSVGDAASVPATASAAAEGRTRSRSPAGSRQSHARTNATKVSTSSPQEKLRRHLAAIDLAKIVCGGKLGNELNHGQRAATVLLEDNPAASVQLEAHLKLARVAQQVTVQRLGKVPKEKRLSLLKVLYPHMPQVPEEWKWK